MDAALESDGAVRGDSGLSNGGMTRGTHRINHGRHRQLYAAIDRAGIVRMRFRYHAIATPHAARPWEEVERSARKSIRGFCARDSMGHTVTVAALVLQASGFVVVHASCIH